MSAVASQAFGVTSFFCPGVESASDCVLALFDFLADDGILWGGA